MLAYQKTPAQAQQWENALNHGYGLLNTVLGHTLVPLAQVAMALGRATPPYIEGAGQATSWGVLPITAQATQRMNQATDALVAAWPECPLTELHNWRDSFVGLGEFPNSPTRQLLAEEKQRLLLLHPVTVDKLKQLGFDLPAALGLGKSRQPAPPPTTPSQDTGFSHFEL